MPAEPAGQHRNQGANTPKPGSKHTVRHPLAPGGVGEGATEGVSRDPHAAPAPGRGGRGRTVSSRKIKRRDWRKRRGAARSVALQARTQRTARAHQLQRALVCCRRAADVGRAHRILNNSVGRAVTLNCWKLRRLKLRLKQNQSNYWFRMHILKQF